MDAVITKFKVKDQQMKQNDAHILQQRREDINGFLTETNQEAAQNELLERSRNVTELIAIKSNPKNVPILKNIISPVFKPKPISDDVVESFFPPDPDSKIVDIEKKNKKLAAIGATTDKTLFTFQTPYKQLFRVARAKTG